MMISERRKSVRRAARDGYKADSDRHILWFGTNDLAQNNSPVSHFDATGRILACGCGGASRLLLHTTRPHAFRPPLLSDGYAVAEERRATWRRACLSSSERNDPPGERSVDLVPPPLGLPQRSECLATRNAASPPPFAVCLPFRAPGLRPGARKGKQTANNGCGLRVVVEHSLRWGRPSGGEITLFD